MQPTRAYTNARSRRVGIPRSEADVFMLPIIVDSRRPAVVVGAGLGGTSIQKNGHVRAVVLHEIEKARNAVGIANVTA